MRRLMKRSTPQFTHQTLACLRFAHSGARAEFDHAENQFVVDFWVIPMVTAS